MTEKESGVGQKPERRKGTEDRRQSTYDRRGQGRVVTEARPRRQVPDRRKS
ncbi:MAG: hypothetical protein KDI19_11930 [Pseudomonadales bacterium]|nr:hypothetical protein [Pseudomonadales bacterium]